jgi:L-arabinokinase
MTSRADDIRPAVVFYISGHGFGHASRQVEVIHALAAVRPDLHIVIRSSVAPDLLTRTLRVPYELRRGPVDAGIVQRSSIEHDHDATAAAAESYYRPWADRIAEERRRLADLDVRLVVGDIPPVAFATAAAIAVPSVAIANFTWDWIYEDEPALAGARGWLLPLLRAAYAQATLALELPFSGGFEVFPARRALPLVARRPTRSRAGTRAGLGLPADRPLALLSFGGYGLPALDLSAVDCLDDWTIVTTDRVTPGGGAADGRIVRLDEAVFAGGRCRYEDLVAAVDVVVTKPGYGIIAECIAARTAMLYTSRGHFREYEVLVSALPRHVKARFLSQPDLLGGRWRAALEALGSQPDPPETVAIDGAERASDVLATYVSR